MRLRLPKAAKRVFSLTAVPFANCSQQAGAHAAHVLNVFGEDANSPISFGAWEALSSPFSASPCQSSCSAPFESL